ncbi:insulinase family protein [Bacteroidetes/Chlorobi group bacterium Naka2016]|jgi:predicted Zn-dependent peptidase|nr:MAG: insulinase family protein [Bacteroidetes/Chlorobi group bacterium Naka2016]
MKRKNKFFRGTTHRVNQTQFDVCITKLANGVTVINEQIPYYNSFALGIGVKVGSRDDYFGKEGISHLLEHCVFRRTQNYESKQINELFEKFGSYSNAFTTKEYTAYYVRALNQNFEKVWNLLSEIVFQPKFDKRDIAKEKSIVKEEIRSYNEDPEEEIFDVTDKYLFQNSSLAHPIVGKIKTVNSISLEDISNFYQDFYQSNNVVVVYIGEMDDLELIDKISQKLENLTKSTKRVERVSTIIEHKTFNIKLKRQFLQSHISFAKTFPNLSIRERYLGAIANLLLGDCASSRLYKSLREKSALVYNVFSTFTSYSDTSAIYIYATTNPNKKEKTIGRIQKELELIHNVGFDENELLLAKEQLKSTTIMALENSSERMQSIIKSQLTFGRYESLYETIDIVDSITLDELNKFAKKHFAPDSWSSIIFEPK